MWELDHKESWAPKNWCFQIVVLKKILMSLLNNKEINLMNPKGNQPWIFTGRTDAKAEAPILWSSDVNSWHIGKDPDAEKDQRQEEKRVTEDEMVGWHHRLNRHEFEQIPGDSEGQGRLACCGPGSMRSQRVEHCSAAKQQMILLAWLLGGPFIFIEGHLDFSSEQTLHLVEGALVLDFILFSLIPSKLFLLGRTWRGTKKPLDESKRGEWKSWLKAQHSEN